MERINLNDEQRKNIWAIDDYLNDIGTNGPDFNLFDLIVDKGNKSRILLSYKNKLIGQVKWLFEEKK